MNPRRSFLIPAIILAILISGVLFAGFFAPSDAADQQRALPFAPPMRLRFVDEAGGVHLRPFVYAWASKPGTMREYEEDRSQRYPLKVLVSGSEYRVLGVVRSRAHLFGVDAPGNLALLGRDGYGRDQFSRLLFGGQVSLLAGILAAALSLVLGMLIGVAAGFYGGWVDNVLMRFSELFFALPWLYLLLAVRAFLPLHIGAATAFLLIVGVIGLVGWARPARLVRGIVLSAKERNYVLAARGYGASNWYLVRRHVLPATYGVLLTQAALLVPQYILAEVTLSFLGLGIAEPLASWGTMLGSVQHYHVLASYWWMLAPAFALFPLFFACQRLADVLQQRLQFSA